MTAYYFRDHGGGGGGQDLTMGESTDGLSPSSAPSSRVIIALTSVFGVFGVILLASTALLIVHFFVLDLSDYILCCFHKQCRCFGRIFRCLSTESSASATYHRHQYARQHQGRGTWRTHHGAYHRSSCWAPSTSALSLTAGASPIPVPGPHTVAEAFYNPQQHQHRSRRNNIVGRPLCLSFRRRSMSPYEHGVFPPLPPYSNRMQGRGATGPVCSVPASATVANFRSSFFGADMAPAYSPPPVGPGRLPSEPKPPSYEDTVGLESLTSAGPSSGARFAFRAVSPPPIRPPAYDDVIVVSGDGIHPASAQPEISSVEETSPLPRILAQPPSRHAQESRPNIVYKHRRAPRIPISSTTDQRGQMIVDNLLSPQTSSNESHGVPVDVPNTEAISTGGISYQTATHVYSWYV